MNRFIRYTQPGGASLFPLLVNRRRWTALDAEAGRLVEAALTGLAAPAYAARVPIDLYEDKDNTYVRATLPGVSREAISIEMADGHLTLGVERKDEDKPYTLSRSIAIPESVQADKVSATYENGILTVTLPKQEQAKPRKINIAVN
jgi:HSP20 family protein